ncbi:MAG TPA: O-antigen ligase family protein [Planctomycetota bacterium]|nr:O-antigen ligase family protein [Planctomycetota bacterium]
MSPEQSNQDYQHPLQRGVLYLALGVIALAPFVYGSYPPWISGLTAGLVCALGALHVFLALIFKSDFFPVPRALQISAYLMLAWLGAMVARDAFGASGPTVSASISVRTLPYALAYFAAGMLGACFNSAIRGRAGADTLRIKWAYIALTSTGAVLAALALIQWMGFDVKSWSAEKIQHPRVSGILISANRFAVMEALCLSCALALFLATFKEPDAGRRDELRRRARQLALLLIIAGMGMSMVLTLSRLTIVAFGIGLASIALIWTVQTWREQKESAWGGSRVERIQRAAFLALPLIVVLGYAALALTFGAQRLMERLTKLGDEESGERMAAIKVSTQLLNSTDARLFGHGLGGFEYAFTPIQPATLDGRWNRLHSDWLQLAIEAGLPALALAVALTFFWLLAWKKNLPRGEEATAFEWSAGFQPAGSRRFGKEVVLRLVPLAGVVTVLISTALDFPLREPSLALAFFFLAGMLARSADVQPAGSRRFYLRIPLGIALLAALGWSAFIAGRNGIAFAASPLFGQWDVPFKFGKDVSGWERPTAIDPGEAQLHFGAAMAALNSVDEARKAGRTFTTATEEERAAWARGLEHALAAQALSPRDFEMPWAASRLSAALGDWTAADALRRRALELSPGNRVLLLELGSYWLTRVKMAPPVGSVRAQRVAEALAAFRSLIRIDPGYAPGIAQWMENADCDLEEILQLWEGDSPQACVERAIYLWKRKEFESAEQALAPLTPAALAASKKEAIWYHALKGASEFKRHADDKGVSAWSNALELEAVHSEAPVLGWMTVFARDEFAVDQVEKLAALGEKLRNAPTLVNVLGLKLHQNGRDFSACKLLEKTAGNTDYLCMLYAECALAAKDWETAAAQAARVRQFSSNGSDWTKWLANFELRLAQQKKR